MKNKQMMIIGAVILVLVVLIGGFVLVKGNKKDTTETRKDILPQTDVIPTVDSSVKVELTGINSNKEVMLAISGIPKDTLTVEYEMSYLSNGSLPKGVIGTIDLDGKDNVERKITLGTCSSGTCVYDTGVQSVKVSLKFNGSYGSKAYDHEFPLSEK
jgi:hypothetical protein